MEWTSPATERTPPLMERANPFGERVHPLELVNGKLRRAESKKTHTPVVLETKKQNRHQQQRSIFTLARRASMKHGERALDTA